MRAPRLPRSLPPLSLVLLLVVVAGSVAGCGSGAQTSGDDRRALPAPIKIDHRFGTTTIEKVPKRVVTIDLQWTDVMLALGVEPVGYSVDARMPQSRVPWQRLPAQSTALSVDDGVPVEKILALDPDLVVASFSLSSEETYRQLSARVPTIAGPAQGKVTPWQELVYNAGAFLDRRDAAKKVVESVQGRVVKTARELPALNGRTFSLAQYIVGDSMYIVADEKDGSSLFFQQLGMKLYPPVSQEGTRTGAARINVSTERADLLRADLLAFLVNGGDRRNLADIPGFNQLPGTVAVLDYPTIVGLNTPSPLSIPYALERMRPYLDEAASKAG